MRAVTPINQFFASAILLLVTGAAAVVHAADPERAHETGVDMHVHPGDDFFAYANGDWLKNTPLVGKGYRWNARTEIEATTAGQLDQLLREASNSPPGSLGRKVADFQIAWSDGEAIEARGIAPLRQKLADIDAVHNATALARLLGRELPADVDPLNVGTYQSRHVLGLSASQGIHGETTYTAFLVQGGLGIPDRSMYIGNETKHVALRDAYRVYLASLFKSIGLDRPDARAAAVLAFEIALARTHLPEDASANERNAENNWTREDFARLAPGMDWDAFFESAGLEDELAFVAWQPDAITGLAAMVAQQPMDVWRDYLRARVIDRNADVLPQSYAAPVAVLRKTVTSEATPDRDRRAYAATLAHMAPLIGRLYVERHFPAGHRERVERIVADVKAALRRRVEASTWMASATRTQALRKLDRVRFSVGYPRQWPDFSNLEIDRNDPVGNLERIAAFDRHITLARLGKTVDRDSWWIAPQTVGAVLLFQQNAYNFPAAFLQPPKFDARAPEAMNYGAIGAIVGHELSHFVDTLGANWDAKGDMRQWWSPGDDARFQRAAGSLSIQVSRYEPLPKTEVDGIRTQVENVADLAGLMAAFDAHRSVLVGRSPDEVRSLDRAFFLGFARSWRGVMGEEALREYLAHDGHTPEQFRIAIVRNLDAWHEAFNVTPGHRLYLAPELRVHVW